MLAKISYDLWNEILRDLNMFDTIKLSHVNEDMFNMCNRNDIWKRHYNALFDRRIITDKSKHIGPITWFHCRCGPYPGWSKIHTEMESGVCRKIDHYEDLEKRVIKRHFKCFKNQTKKKYLQLLKNDQLITHMHVHKYNKADIETKLNDLKSDLAKVDETLNEARMVHSLIQKYDT